MSHFELRIYRLGRYRKQNFPINIFQRKTNSEKNQVFNSIFEKQDFDEKFICEKNRFDSTCFTESNRISKFRAYFKKHDSEADLFIENQCLKWGSFEKKIGLWSNFFLENEILTWKFFNKSDFELKIYRPGRYRKHNFSNNHISEKN